MAGSGRFPPIGGWSLSGPFEPVAIVAATEQTYGINERQHRLFHRTWQNVPGMFIADRTVLSGKHQ